MHPAMLSDSELLKQCSIRNERRSGPGGQHRNKVETAVVVTHRPTSAQGDASESRDRIQNQKQAIRRLRLNLALCVRDDWECPSELWNSRLRDQKISVSPNHKDFPSILAEALDALSVHDNNLPKTAKSCGTTTSQLINLFKKHQPAFGLVNKIREQLGLRKLS